MSRSETMSAVSHAFKFASEKTVQNLTEFIKREEFELNENQIRSLMSVVENSVTQALSLAGGSIQKTLD